MEVLELPEDPLPAVEPEEEPDFVDEEPVDLRVLVRDWLTRVPLAELDASTLEAARVAEVPFLERALVFATGEEVMIAAVALATAELRAAELVATGMR